MTTFNHEVGEKIHEIVALLKTQHIIRSFWLTWYNKIQTYPSMYGQNLKNLKCGRLEHGFLRVRCESCHNEFLVAFSCKRRGFWPSCGARRTAESAAWLVDDFCKIKSCPMSLYDNGRWAFLFSLGFCLQATLRSGEKYEGLSIAHWLHITKKAGGNKQTEKTGAVTLIRRFGSALNLNIYFQMLFLGGVYAEDNHGRKRLDEKHPCFSPCGQPLVALIHCRWIGHRIKAPNKCTCLPN